MPERVPGAQADELEVLLEAVPFLRGLERVDLARLVGALEEQEVAAGTALFAEGDHADGLYLLASGRVEVSGRSPEGSRALARLRAPGHFGELGLLLPRRTGGARAVTDVQLWKLPRERFERLIRERPATGLALAASLAVILDERSRGVIESERHPALPAALPTAAAAVRSTRRRLAGLAGALAVPALLWTLQPPGNLSADGWHVTVLLLGAAVAWLAEPVPDFVIALLLAAAWGIADLASPSLSFAGFASSAWLLALGALAVAAAAGRSGLLFRVTLWLLRAFPATHVGQVLALLAGGVVATPVVPLALARLATVGPIAHELARTLGYPVRGRASAAIGLSALAGYAAFSNVFLTGFALNFFVRDLLPEAEEARFDWLTWLEAAAPTGVLLLLGAGVVLVWVMRPELHPKVTAETLRRQQRVLGPPSRRELGALAALAVLLLGFLLQPTFGLDPAWPALVALALAVGAGGLDRASFRSSIDWGFLVLFGVLLGTAGVLHEHGVDTWIGAGLASVGDRLGSPTATVVLLALFVVAVRVLLDLIPATVLLCLALVPAAGTLGLSPWVVGFVVLAAANPWPLPRQSILCRLMRETTDGELFSDRDAALLGAVLTGITVAALALSVPYWRAIGVLTP